jgi:uncharacterized lipoprotein YajG
LADLERRPKIGPGLQIGSTNRVPSPKNKVSLLLRESSLTPSRLWRSYGVEVEISTRDVTTKQGCLDLIREATELGPIDAIFNLAVVLKDALLEDQTEETFRLSLAPKARTTIYLDQITREICPHLR